MATTYKGEFFQSDPSEKLRVAVHRGGESVAETLLITWYVNLDERIKVNQYRYLSGLTKEESGEDSWSVHDDVSYVYGPWLEGKGSQNPRSTFKGYFALRNARRSATKDARDIVESEVHDAVVELGGT